MEVRILGRWDKARNEILRHGSPRIIHVREGEVRGVEYSEEDKYYLLRTGREEDYIVDEATALAVIERVKEKQDG